jgi:ABC-type proline/glycine betaine transport system ATPase subunit
MTRALPCAVELHDLTKSFGDVLAVDEVSAVALPGEVTALLGPNGAGKTTTFRMLLGLVAPSSGTATFGGRRYDELTDPVRRVGAVLEASGCHPGRTALDHLRVLVTASRLPQDAPHGRDRHGLAVVLRVGPADGEVRSPAEPQSQQIRLHCCAVNWPAWRGPGPGAIQRLRDPGPV